MFGEKIVVFFYETTQILYEKFLETLPPKKKKTDVASCSINRTQNEYAGLENT